MSRKRTRESARDAEDIVFDERDLAMELTILDEFGSLGKKAEDLAKRLRTRDDRSRHSYEVPSEQLHSGNDSNGSTASLSPSSQLDDFLYNRSAFNQQLLKQLMFTAATSPSTVQRRLRHAEEVEKSEKKCCRICLLEREEGDDVHEMMCCRSVVHHACIERCLCTTRTCVGEARSHIAAGSRNIRNVCQVCQCEVNDDEMKAVRNKAKSIKRKRKKSSHRKVKQ